MYTITKMWEKKKTPKRLRPSFFDKIGEGRYKKIYKYRDDPRRKILAVEKSTLDGNKDQKVLQRVKYMITNVVGQIMGLLLPENIPQTYKILGGHRKAIKERIKGGKLGLWREFMSEKFPKRFGIETGPAELSFVLRDKYGIMTDSGNTRNYRVRDNKLYYLDDLTPYKLEDTIEILKREVSRTFKQEEDVEKLNAAKKLIRQLEKLCEMEHILSERIENSK